MKLSKILALLLITAFSVSVGYSSPPTNKDYKEKVQVSKLTASYSSQVGVRELTGHNDGIMVETYLHTVGLEKGYPWCAAFVKWNLIQAGIPNTIDGAAASVHNPQNLVLYGHRLIKPLRPGDTFTLWFIKLNRIGHTGFYDKTINSTVYRSCEGNTNEAGSREGDGVYWKYRSFRATYSISRWEQPMAAG